MGIRFYCPNGHRLHVKSHLAGKRGICPRCGVGVEIPLESTEEASAQASGDATPTASRQTVAQVAKLSQDTGSAAPAVPPTRPTAPATDRPVQKPAPAASPLPVAKANSAGAVQPAEKPSAAAPQQQRPAAPVDAPTHDRNAAQPTVDPKDGTWYVRPAAGGQYGPADGELFRVWMAEGRVPADALVWRDGWPQWKRAGEAFPQLLESAPAVPTAGLESIDLAAAELQQKLRRKRANRRAMWLVLLLTIACLILLAILIYVLKVDKPRLSVAVPLPETGNIQGASA